MAGLGPFEDLDWQRLEGEGTIAPYSDALAGANQVEVRLSNMFTTTLDGIVPAPPATTRDGEHRRTSVRVYVQCSQVLAV